MSPESRAASHALLVREIFEHVLPHGDVADAARWVTDDYLDHDPIPGVPDRGVASFAGTMRALRTSHRDLRFVIEALVAIDDTVVVRWTASAVDVTGFGVGPPTFRPFLQRGIAWFRLANDKIAERWAAVDRFAVLAALGLVGAR